MPIPPDALELLKALQAVLDRWGRWYLFGAQAVVAYGVPRFTARGGIPASRRER